MSRCNEGGLVWFYQCPAGATGHVKQIKVCNKWFHSKQISTKYWTDLWIRCNEASDSFVVFVLDFLLECSDCVRLVSVSASHELGREFVPRQGHTTDHHKTSKNCLPALHSCIRVGV